MMDESATIDRSRFPLPQRTTARAGALLLASAVLLLLQTAHAAVPIATTVVVPLNGPPFEWAAAVIRAAAFVLLAVGSAGELGIVARSRIGQVALVVWGARDVIDLITRLLPVPTSGAEFAEALTALQLVLAAAGVVAAIQVVRVRVLWGTARWALLPAAVLDALVAATSSPLPFGPQLVLAVTTAFAAWPVRYLQPVLLLLAAVALLVWGRREALRHRARRIHDAW